MQLELHKTEVPEHLRKYFERVPALSPKNKCMIPARVALALQEDGWVLRQEIVWAKLAPMPESTRDRPTTAHEMVYLFAKSGDTTYYTHPHKPGVRGEVPPPDYRWHDNATGERTAIEPEGWRTELLADGKTKRWRRINLWEGHDYFYDQEGERVPAVYKELRGTFRGGGSYVNGNSFHNSAQQLPTDTGVQRQTTQNRNLWSYWLLSPDPYSEAHFATFPRELARRCISLGTSAYGCCSEPGCGAPWARVVEREKGPYVAPSEIDRFGTGEAGVHRKIGQKYQDWLDAHPAQTVGWKPTCTHDAPVQPCTVLDPFSGAGTTGVVAVGLGRAYVGIELSPVYTEMSERRIAQTQPALPGLVV